MRVEKDPGAFPCSFCGKAEIDGERVVVGPRVNICESCVKTASRILRLQLKQLSKREILDLIRTGG